MENHKRRHADETETVTPDDDCGSLDEDYDCGPFQPAVRVEDVLHAFRPLACPWQKWVQSDIDLAIPILRRRINFIGAGCSVESTSLWEVFVEQWDLYLAAHPKVLRIVDPDYVSFDFSGGVPAAFAADVLGTDARVGVVPTIRADGAPSTCFFGVANAGMAKMFAGRMRALHPGVFCTILSSNTLTFW